MRAVFTVLAMIAPAIANARESLSASCRSHADTVFRNGHIYTVDEDMSEVETMAVKAGVITYVGDEAGIGAHIGNSTKVVDLGGRSMIPGLIDSHLHMEGGGLALIKCNLNYQALRWEQIVAHVTGCAAGDGGGDGAWIEVVNMDVYSLALQSGPIDKYHLDAISRTRPITITASDRHTMLVNSKALELSNVTASTANPSGGVIRRVSGSSQEPSGVLEDNAVYLVKAPGPSFGTVRDAVRVALKNLREAGITTFQEAASLPLTGSVFQAVEREGGLSSRGFFDYALLLDTQSAARVPDLVGDILNVTGTFSSKAELGARPAMKWQAVKAFLDGVIMYPARTGALIESYWNPVDGNVSSGHWAPDNATLVRPYWTQEFLDSVVEQSILNGIDAQFHADGDLSVRYVLNAVEAFRKKHPQSNDYRIGIAHDEISHPDDWPRFKELGVSAIMSFQWAQMSALFVPNTFLSFGPQRQELFHAWGNIQELGGDIIHGSDWPIDPLDPLLALKVAVTRTGDPTNPHSPAFNGSQFDGVPLPGLRISRDEALRAMTIRGARFLRADKHIGSLERGKLADAVILERDYFRVPEEELARNRVLLTMVGGEVVYVADGENFGVEAKFKNDDDLSKKMSARAIGGIEGRGLKEDGVQAMRRLRRREACSHGIHKH